jgi:type IV pili sensor histidine kinase/response regulator
VPEFTPVVRYGRYTLVELAPASAQQDLLLQVVDVAVPETRTATVGDALRHVLLRSGYQLCSSSDIAALNALPLPASHYRLGPLLLRDALLTLAGPAWDLEVDDGARRICFTRAAQPTTGGALPQSGPVSPVDIARPPLKTEARP